MNTNISKTKKLPLLKPLLLNKQEIKFGKKLKTKFSHEFAEKLDLVGRKKGGNPVCRKYGQIGIFTL